jgi:hypothetical protein
MKMKTPANLLSPRIPARTNGSGAAAVLSAGICCFTLAVLAFTADKSASVKSGLNFYRPTGPLSGVTTVAILLWLFVWGMLEWRWHNRTLPMKRINAIALALLVSALILTFPPFVDLF